VAGDWIKLDTTTPDKPEVDAIADALGIDADAAVGKLVRFWVWADQQSICNALSVTEKLIDRVTHQPGFAKALQKVGWLEGSSGSFTIPRFERHNGQTAKARALTNKRVAKHRDHDGNAPSVTSALPEKRESIYTAAAATAAPNPVHSTWSLEHVVEAGNRVGIPKEVCEAYFNNRAAAGWIDAKHRPIASMPHDLATFWRHWQSRAIEDSQSAKRGSGRPQETSKRQPSVWEAQKKIEALQRELERIKADPGNRQPKPESPWETQWTEQGRAAAAAVRQRIKELQAIIAQ
jgi:hypothetical protein